MMKEVILILILLISILYITTQFNSDVHAPSRVRFANTRQERTFSKKTGNIIDDKVSPI